MKQIDDFRNGLSDLIGYFQESPQDFLYESDLQSALFWILHRTLGRRTVTYPVDGKNHVFNLSPVKTEYPSGKRFDVAIIDPDVTDIKKHYDNVLHGSPDDYILWGLPAHIAVEMKYWLPGNKLDDRLKQLESDKKKLGDYQDICGFEESFIGLAVLFVYPLMLPQETKEIIARGFRETTRHDLIGDVSRPRVTRCIVTRDSFWVEDKKEGGTETTDDQ